MPQICEHNSGTFLRNCADNKLQIKKCLDENGGDRKKMYATSIISRSKENYWFMRDMHICLSSIANPKVEIIEYETA